MTNYSHTEEQITGKCNEIIDSMKDFTIEEKCQLKAESDKWCSAADDIQKKLMESMKREAQLRELVAQLRELVKDGKVWAQCCDDEQGAREWLAKAKKLMEGK